MTFTYEDMENRVVSTTGPTASLKLDPLGRLAEVTVVSGTTTQVLYDSRSGPAFLDSFRGLDR